MASDGNIPEGNGTQRDAVVKSLVFVHESVQAAMVARAKSNNGKSSYVTPRHYLDFIAHYAALFNEKRTQLEEQQRHLNTGLRKLRETQEDVLKLREALTKKDIELSEKEKLANEKLEQMVRDQREAEIKRDASEQIAKEIAVQQGDINVRKAQVEGDLANAQPELERAKQSVRGILKADLDQVSRYPAPPALVKLAVEPVIMMLGEPIVDWKQIKGVMRRADFIPRVLSFDIDTLDAKTRKIVREKYLTDPAFTFENVYNASKACGPLVKWVESTLNYARIKNSVEPLEKEMKGLEDKQNVLREKQSELQKICNELGRRIEGFKKDYGVLIGEAQRIKNEISSVKSKVDRSMALLDNLGSERGRWEHDSENFQTQIATVVGDCLLSAAFLAYIGYFNQNYRRMLIDSWSDRLAEVHVKTKDQLSLIDYLSMPSDRLEWRANELPVDDLCIENAIMLNKFNRYPLVIDPSGQATDFLMLQFKKRKIIRTSFLDPLFIKSLESALRFGNALLVEDVENIDPILNSVLNREVNRTGGRVMITLGDKEIDFSPAFTIFLSTRDPTAHFTPDLCSRVTLVNFTVTPDSLTSQCLSKALKSERADIDQKRSDLLKVQGEYRVKLRTLEDQLLDALNAAKGNILDNETVLGSLETLKKEAAEISAKMSESDSVMHECEQVSEQYRPFAAACSSIYFSLENLAQVHFLYQFSLPFFLVIVDEILDHKRSTVAHPELAETKDPVKRLAILTPQLFNVAFKRVSRALLNRDQIAFALRLAQISLEGGVRLEYAEIEFLMRGRLVKEEKAESTSVAADVVQALSLTRIQQVMLAQLGTLPNFSRLNDHIKSNLRQWQAFVQDIGGGEASADSQTSALPTGWEQSTGLRAIFHQLLITRVLRPDQLPVLAASFVTAVFGRHFLQMAQSVDLSDIVSNESSCNTPLLLVSRPGYDASGKVDSLAVAFKNNGYESFAMGSPEGYDQADTAINAASKKGTWVLLKNVHLSPNWLSKLEKRLHRMSPHPMFRLFMTMEMNPKVPVNLLRMSSITVFEPPVGIKASLRRMFGSISPDRVNRAPAERGRLYFLLAWVHAVVLERLRYVPVGWSKGFEFGETDASVAMDAIDEWIDNTAQGRANLSPDRIPWGALQALLEQIVYGGRIDNEFDYARLSAFVKSMFTDKSYGLDFALCTRYDEEGGDGKSQAILKIPDSLNYEGFKKWIDDMPDLKSPELLGLASNAELMLLINHANHVCKQLLQLQDHNTESEAGEEGGAGAPPARDRKKQRLSFSVASEDTKSSRPSWMTALAANASLWLERLPDPASLRPFSGGREMEGLSINPLFRCVQREIIIWSNKLQTVVSDLRSIKAVVEGKDKANNSIRELFKKLKTDQLPETWFHNASSKGLPPNLWIEDFGKRVELMKKMHLVAKEGKTKGYVNANIWLGGLFTPEAFVAASRQAVAQEHTWPLEQLELKVTVNDSTPPNDSFTFVGLTLYSAAWHNDALAISNKKVSSPLPPVRFTWVRRTPDRKEVKSENAVSLPVYLDETRRQFLFSITLPGPAHVPSAVWSQRGSCITVWNNTHHG